VQWENAGAARADDGALPLQTRKDVIVGDKMLRAESKHIVMTLCPNLGLSQLPNTRRSLFSRRRGCGDRKEAFSDFPRALSHHLSFARHQR
jgi:hypothetical protein|tara:strand:- start:1451 stop:1723 length:273 start_codon:yes stop_codon:yes gene_type:complete